jgi:haloalkane dehalogenase
MATETLKKQIVHILGTPMAYHTRGKGPPIVFLHGNPTSSYLWRNVLPALPEHGRLVAPDLIGMGDSGKLPNPNAATYTYDVHREHLWAFLDAVIGSEAVVLVVHDWGSALGFDWANYHREQVRGIAYMEAIVRPLADWSEWNETSASLFQGFRSAAGEKLILERNLFVERVLPGSILRQLSEEEMSEYRRPFLNPQDRWPTLSWPRQIPIGGEPAAVVTRVQAYADWLAQSSVPKLFINAEPGAILVGRQREFCRGWPNQQEVTVPGGHFLQEDSGPAIGEAIAEWLNKQLRPAGA